MQAGFARFLSLIVCASIGSMQVVRAQQVATTTSSNTASTPINLDLSSTKANLPPGQSLGSKTVNIQVGNSSVPITSSSTLTPAERLAVYQVLHAGHQSIVLGALGNATGGTFNIGPNFGHYVNSVNIPHGVTAIANLTSTAGVTLGGNLTNAGILYAVSSNPAINTAILNASNITNTQGALLSTVVPAGTNLGLANLVSNLNLTLNAVNNIVNAGTITSAGALNLTAGGTITNALPIGLSGTAPVMQAIGDVNLFASNLANSGAIISQLANINIASSAMNNLTVQNMNGLLSAPAGVINVRDSSFLGNMVTEVLGGSISAKQLNIFGGSGAVGISVDSLNAVLNLTAGSAKTEVANGDLTLGNLCLSGDPDFYSLTGNVLLQGSIVTAGAPLAVVAYGDITTTSSNPVTITTSGGNVTLVAGAQVNCNGGCAGQSPPSPLLNDTLTISGFNSGGNIFLTNMGSLRTSSSTGSGGNVQMMAPGAVWVANNIITSGSGAGNKSGDVTIFAGANAGQAIKTGTILTCPVTNSGADAGSITINNQAPSVAPSAQGNLNVVIVNGDIATGSPTYSGTFGLDSSSAGGGDVLLGALLAFNQNSSGNAGSAQVLAPNSSVTISGIQTSTASSSGTAGGIIAQGATLKILGIVDSHSSSGTPGSVALTSTNGQLFVGGTTNASASFGTIGGTVSVGSTGGPILMGAIDNSSIVGNGGWVFLTANGAGILTGPITSSGLTNGGKVYVSGTQVAIQSIDAHSSVLGGTIKLSGSDVSIFGNVSGLSLNANGVGFGGSITIAATDTSNNFIVGVPSINGSGASISAQGLFGNVHISSCADLLINPGSSVSAPGGVTFDHACCATPTTSPVTSATLTNTLSGPVLVASSPDSLSVAQVLASAQAASDATPNITNNDQTLGGAPADVLPAPQIAPGAPPLLPPPSQSPWVGSGQRAGLITSDGAGLITSDGAGLITSDGAGLITSDGAGLITSDGAGLITSDGAGLITSDGAGMLASGDKNPVPAATGTEAQQVQQQMTNDTTQNQSERWSITTDTMSKQFDLQQQAIQNVNGGPSPPAPPLADANQLMCPTCGASFGGLSPIGFVEDANKQRAELRKEGWITAQPSKRLGGAIPFYKGAGLFAGDRPTKVATRNALVEVSPGAAALLLAIGPSLAVYNLHDNHSNDLRVHTKSGVITLNPGQMINISSVDGPFEKVCPGRGISYRHERAMKVGKLNGYTADFSISSAMANVPPLQAMCKSKLPHQRKLVDEMLKDEAVVMYMHAKDGPYKALKEM
nr:hypothetical protein Hi04_10k_c2089_00065 [uncultured bacterium]